MGKKLRDGSTDLLDISSDLKEQSGYYPFICIVVFGKIFIFLVLEKKLE